MQINLNTSLNQTMISNQTATPLVLAENIFAKFGTADASQKNQMVDYLNQAYQKIDLDNLENSSTRLKQISRIYYLYGRRLYGGDMLKSSKMFEASLMAKALDIKAVDSFTLPKISSLEAFADELTKNQAQADLPTLISGIEWEGKMTQQSEAENFQMAEKLRWLGHSYQNISTFNKPENAKLFEKIYGAATSILEKINTKDADWEIGQIKYNTTRFVHLLNNPGDALGSLQTLKEIEKYLEKEGSTVRAQTLKAQILNIIAVTSFKITKGQASSELLEEYYRGISKAVDIANSTQEFDNNFLKDMFSFNKASMAYDCHKAGKSVEDIEQIEKAFDDIYKGMEKEEFKHDYYPGYLKTMAQFKSDIGKPEESKMLLEKAEDISPAN